MDIKSLILKKLSQGKEIRVADITKATGFSRAYINRFFQELRQEGKVILLERANRARYVLATSSNLREAKREPLHFQRIFKNINLSEDAVLDQIKKESGIFVNLPKNIYKILDYAFTEMLNNAIEHSKSNNIRIGITRSKNNVKFTVIDSGIGIFRNIMKKYRLHNELEAIQELLKGKHTTAPSAHTGEGIFFTSKAADTLIIKGSNKKLIFNNQINDIFVKDIKRINGTKVAFQISLKSKRDLAAVFREYGNSAFEFSKTKVAVDLYKLDTAFISRSQARRVTSGLDKFKTITLDFKNVDTVGQAFADEVFRVWKSRYPRIEINYQNANENIEFMIKRAVGAQEIHKAFHGRRRK